MSINRGHTYIAVQSHRAEYNTSVKSEVQELPVMTRRKRAGIAMSYLIPLKTSKQQYILWVYICDKTPRFDPWVGKIHWRREWQPTPVFLPGESHEQRSLVGSQSRTQLSLHACDETTLKKKERGFPGGPMVENPPANAENMGSIPGSRRFHTPWGC